MGHRAMRYFLIAGEASGDLHAANLIKGIKECDPEAEFYAYGGELMESAGATMLRYYKDIAYMGVVSVMLHLRTILGAMKRCKKEILSLSPDVVILVDYPGFNLSIAKYVKTHTQIPVYYYIAPKIWAWKENRIKLLRAYVDEIFSILPFEQDYFSKRGVEIHYVGNPTVDEVEEYRQAHAADTAEAFALKNGLDPARRIIALLAGSRKQEINYNLRLMCEAARPFVDKGFQLVVAGAPNLDNEIYSRNIPADMQRNGSVKLVYSQTYALLSFAESALVTSGTATLETAVFKVPQVVCYYIPCGKIVSLLRRCLLKVKFISLVNLIAGKEVVRELVADGMTTDRARAELEAVTLNPQEREKMMEGYARISDILGATGAADHAAKGITKCLRERKQTKGSQKI